MTTATLDLTPGAPLTLLSEDEQMFQQSVRDFAIEKIRPLVHDMDREAPSTNLPCSKTSGWYLNRNLKTASNKWRF